MNNTGAEWQAIQRKIHSTPQPEDSTNVDHLKEKLNRMEQQNQILREALEFYANEKNWYVITDEPGCSGCLMHVGGPHAAIVYDAGQAARKALQGEG